MGFAILADFPLGTYRAHRGDGTADSLPSPARLHAALVSAAAQGPRAVAFGDQLQPSPIDRAALEWLEHHPPDGLAIPPTTVAPTRAAAFRAEGFFGVREDRRVLGKNLRKDPIVSVALGGPIAWTWDDVPPDEIRDAISALCAETPYLGTVDSPVNLWVGEATPTHRRDPSADFLLGDGVEVEVAAPGRLTSLEQHYRRVTAPARVIRGDAVAKAEQAIVDPVVREGLRRAAYVAPAAPAPAVPWPTVVLIPVDARLRVESRVQACVALHRALVGLIGDGAPALVTGRYEPAAARPANHLAIQYLPGSLPLASQHGAPGAFALLVPPASPEDLVVLHQAVTSLRVVRMGSRGVARITGAPIAVRGDAVWEPLAAGHERLWITEPAAIAESRPIRGGTWTVGDAAMLSLGLVLRDQFPRQPQRSAWYRSLVGAVASAGAEVLAARKLHTSDVGRYVHRITIELAVQPYHALLRLGSLAGSGTILAIGQSRHLGGGLLVPFDVPIGSGWALEADGGTR